MKQVVYTIFVAFWTAVLTIIALDAMTPTAEAGDSGTASASYTLAEVAEHGQLDDCWMAIEGKVYDFTDYIDQHPTPPAVMAPWCGKEATEGMRTKGYGRDHSERAWQMAEQYLIGELADPDE
ncbi:MAG: cytochrome b5 domain-containing protein [Gammaproteobacteria bacterium]|jgi:cytochrome b involved in lipid metabolism|nr:cytochrome b5 domain-containing protein [Gammaproteobacteria bacterium]